MHIHRQLAIACPPRSVWRCLTEFELQKEWITQLVDETPDQPNAPVGIGSASNMRLREGGKTVTYRCVVTKWQPERKLGICLSGGSFAAGMNMHVVYDLKPTELGTTLDYDVQVPLKGLFFKLMAPLIWIAAASNAKKDLTKLKSLAPTITIK
jgi:carbon monoxide dehydrogenase subunit G